MTIIQSVFDLPYPLIGTAFDRIEAAIEQPNTIPCGLDIPKLLHVGWYRCTTPDECRMDWDKSLIAHIQNKTKVHIVYPDRYDLNTDGNLIVKVASILPEDGGKWFICRGKIQFQETMENSIILEIAKGEKLQNCCFP